MAGSALLMMGCGAEAADTFWLGGADTWFNAANWDAGVPTASDNAFLGLSADVLIDGAGAAADMLTVSGAAGGVVDSTLTIATNSADLATGNAIVGTGAGNLGIIDVTTFGSWVNSGVLTLGESGTGTLNVSSSAGVTLGNTLAAVNGGSNAAITVTDAGFLRLGQAVTQSVLGGMGAATMVISSGSDVLAYALMVGQGSTGNGSIALDGAGSTLVTQGDLTIGGSGTGDLTVTGNADVTVAGDFIVGSEAVGNGSVLVMGSGSDLTLQAGAQIGRLGQGTIAVLNGATVTSGGGTMELGGGAAALGIADVAGSGSGWVHTGLLRVAGDGNGQINIYDAGFLTADSVTIGQFSGSIGDIEVRGAGSNLTVASGDLVIGGAGVGQLTVSEGAEVNVAGDVWIAGQSGSAGWLNIGGAGPAAATGSFNAASVQFGDGTGVVNFNHTDANHIFASTFSGMGTINHLSGVTRLTGVSTGFTGTTNITGGALYVNDTLAGTINVNGGTLGGGGYLLGNATVGSGGTFAPGNSIGSLNFAGNLAFAAGSIYEVELNDGGFVAGTNNDFASIGGTLTINGGTVHVTPENGTDTGLTYLPGTYTILTAVGGVTGTFDALTDDYAFLSFVLGYGPNNVLLTSSAVASFCLTDMSANQCAAGDGVFSVASGSVFDAVLGLSNAEAPGALDQLSGEIHASARTALIEDSRFAREAAINRLTVALGGIGADAGEPAQETPEGATLWAQGFGAWSRWAGNGNAANLDRSIGGLFIGADAELTSDVYLGLMGGYSRSALGVDDRASSATVDSYTLGAYAGGAWDAVSLKGGIANSWHSLNSRRSVAFTGFSDSLSAIYGARTFQAFGEAAYSIDAGNVRFEPFANLAHVRLSTDGYTEAGGAAALTAAAQTLDATFTTLGLRAETEVALGEMQATLSGGLGWRHAFGAVPTSTHAFAAGGNAFTVAGVPIAKDTLVLDAGFNLNLTDNATLGFAYNGQFGSSASDNSLKANLSVSF